MRQFIREAEDFAVFLPRFYKKEGTLLPCPSNRVAILVYTGLQDTIDTLKAIRVAIDAAKAAGEILRYYWAHIYQGMDSSYQQRYKRDTSIQTTADLEAERIILKHIRDNFPGHSIDSEEQGYIPSSTSPYIWVVDPLDGTENFVQGIPYFSSSITLCKGNQLLLAVVYNPITGHLYRAEKGQGAQLDIEFPEYQHYHLHISQTEQLKRCRTFFNPDFDTKHNSDTNRIRNVLYGHCRRVLDSWSPALDWCLVASGKADSVVAIADRSIRPDAGILILQEAGGKVTDFQNHEFSNNNRGKLVGSNNVLHKTLLELVNGNLTNSSS